MIVFYFRGGLRGRELVNTVGKVMIQGGGSFGTFLAIGSGIRCWNIESIISRIFFWVIWKWNMYMDIFSLRH